MGDPKNRACLIAIMVCVVLSGCGLFVKRIPAGEMRMTTPAAKDQFVKVGNVNYH